MQPAGHFGPLFQSKVKPEIAALISGTRTLNYWQAAESAGSDPGESSAQVRERVIAARQRQQARFAHKPRITCNARMGSRELKSFCTLKPDTLEMLKMAMTEKNLSARAYDRILKVSRTIADLAGAETITTEHVMEAVQFRSLDQQLWV